MVLNSDKVDYTNWDDLDYTLALLVEYWGDPDSAKSSIKYAWYHVPILSDSPSAEFIKFRKYTTGDVLDENGKKRLYDDVILDKLVDLVNQEYDRIMLVRERDEAYQRGDRSVEPIANYDIVRKKDGSIKVLEVQNLSSCLLLIISNMTMGKPSLTDLTGLEMKAQVLNLDCF